MKARSRKRIAQRSAGRRFAPAAGAPPERRKPAPVREDIAQDIASEIPPEIQRPSLVAAPPAAPAPGFVRRRRPRERETWLALACLVAVSAVFLIWPGIDLRVGAWFLASDGDGRFVGNDYAPVRIVYQIVPWFGRLAALAGLACALLWWRRPGLIGVRWWRRSMFLALALLLVVGGVVNGVLQGNWGRARPAMVLHPAHQAPFSPAWHMVGNCKNNCSFVSGHAATGFVVAALGMLGTLRTRRRWLLIGAASGLLVGLGRIAQGGHFLSDVVLCGLIVWLALTALRWLWLYAKCLRRRRLTK